MLAFFVTKIRMVKNALQDIIKNAIIIKNPTRLAKRKKAFEIRAKRVKITYGKYEK